MRNEIYYVTKPFSVGTLLRGPASNLFLDFLIFSAIEKYTLLDHETSEKVIIPIIRNLSHGFLQIENELCRTLFTYMNSKECKRLVLTFRHFYRFVLTCWELVQRTLITNWKENDVLKIHALANKQLFMQFKSLGTDKGYLIYILFKKKVNLSSSEQSITLSTIPDENLIPEMSASELEEFNSAFTELSGILNSFNFEPLLKIFEQLEKHFQESKVVNEKEPIYKQIKEAFSKNPLKGELSPEINLATQIVSMNLVKESVVSKINSVYMGLALKKVPDLNLEFLLC